MLKYNKNLGEYMIGIIGAMSEEVDIIKDIMVDISEIKISDRTFYKGKFNDKEVVLALSGIGMVNATITTTLLINEFKIDKIYFSGVAGSINKDVNLGDIVISDSLVEYLFDATAFGYKIGEIPRMNSSEFKPNEILLDAKNKLKNEKIKYGKILSGDKFVSSKSEKEKLGKDFDALAVDMESAAIAHTAVVLGVDFLIIRSISDSITDDSTMEYSEFVNIAANNSKNILLKLI